MEPVTTVDLKSAIEELAHPFESANDVKLVSMKLDVIAAALLRDRSTAARLGEQSTTALTSASAELPAVLRAIAAVFTKGAVSVEDLLALSRSSLVDFGTAEQELVEANTVRQLVYDALRNALTSLDE